MHSPCVPKNRKTQGLTAQLRLEQSVVDDVARIRSHPLVPRDIPVYGYIYDVKSGRLIEVEAATAAGRADSAHVLNAG
jgi:carbonic anhydrase